MTPDDAAAELGVPVGASRQQIERAYRRLARASHPQPRARAAMREQALAQARFVRATEARNVLLVALTATDAAASATRLPPKHNWLLLGTWVALMLLAIAVSVVGSPLPLTIWEPTLRFSLMVVSAVGFALSGARVWLVLLGVAIAATALTTIVFTTFGALLGMLLLAAPLYGLFVAGRARAGFSRDRRPSPR